MGTAQTIYDLVRQHKYTLLLTGHSHGTALQGTDDRIYVTIFDQSTGNAVEQFNVGPQ